MKHEMTTHTAKTIYCTTRVLYRKLSSRSLSPIAEFQRQSFTIGNVNFFVILQVLVLRCDVTKADDVMSVLKAAAAGGKTGATTSEPAEKSKNILLPPVLGIVHAACPPQQFFGGGGDSGGNASESSSVEEADGNKGGGGGRNVKTKMALDVDRSFLDAKVKRLQGG